jgi:quinol monooxygenase YgiN
MEKFVVARLFIHAPFIQEFHRAIEQLTVLSREEPGCLEYGWYADPLVAGTFAIIERYRDQESLQYHFSRPYLQHFADKVNAWSAKELQVHFLSTVPGMPADQHFRDGI